MNIIQKTYNKIDDKLLCLSVMMMTSILTNSAFANANARFNKITGEQVKKIQANNLETGTTNMGKTIVGVLFVIATIVGVFWIISGLMKVKKVQQQNSDVTWGRVGIEIIVGAALTLASVFVAWASGGFSALMDAVSGS